MENQEQPLDRKDLKIQALLQKISNMTAQYENQYADLRVEYTILEENFKQFVEQHQSVPQPEEGADEVPQADVLEASNED